MEFERVKKVKLAAWAPGLGLSNVIERPDGTGLLLFPIEGEMSGHYKVIRPGDYFEAAPDGLKAQVIWEAKDVAELRPAAADPVKSGVVDAR